MILTLPILTVSEANVRTHWAKRAKRAKGQRFAAGIAVRAEIRKLLPFPIPALVTLTRIAPRELDDDNLRGALKAVRDGVADALGVDDRDPRVTWAYEQRRGPPKTLQVEIRVVRR